MTRIVDSRSVLAVRDLERSTQFYIDVLALRENARTDDVSKVKRALLERSGNISAILSD